MEVHVTDVQRFELELEFVQSLANPQYLTFLGQRGYFKEKTFVNYLKYLQYWKTKEYSHFLKYPQCLHFLDLLQSEHFRRELSNAQCSKFIEEQQLLHWHLYTKKRMQHHIMAEKQSSNQTVKQQPLKNQ
ncbi:PREDICTED: mediator of RNA polymerase II transcription subunit 31-like [Amphimedon queenslandica]|uniref:Mediator of RNA polymerase II transcription subunit 31 n=1 Tax=Amphimedon queenslandica TaxID=400682 RepID=A0A1X7U4Y5_AMPQE|nr:PREDICTED: mediator of RNA polymerase II transcription subunit 31-like [Amphimedon queenslandica]|eukprot:XP_019856081.1 PREDICTED: mediator of RNA polymerase II transcription subunit 31-like [Amphimedon queenslandica]